MRTRDERGGVAVFVAVVASALFLVAALVVDLGLARDVRRQSQNSADASALAAANILYTGVDLDGDGLPGPAFRPAVEAALAYAQSNFGVARTAWSSCVDAGRLPHVVPGTTGCVSFDSASRPTTVRVRIPTRDVATGFGALAGVSSIEIASSAVAGMNPGRSLRCSLCVLGNGPHDVGNGDIRVTNSSVHFNGSIGVGPQGRVEAPGHQITVEGSVTGGNFVPQPLVHAGRIGDPLASLALPSYPTRRGTDPCREGPGVYGSITFDKHSCASGSLSPGVYVLTGTWSFGNKFVLSAPGVTLYATCSTDGAPRACLRGEEGGAFDPKNGEVHLSGGQVSGHQVAILYDRENTSDVSVQGNGETTITGTVYARSAALTLNGNTHNSVHSGSIVVDSIDIDGNPNVLSVTNGFEQTWTLPPSDLHLQQ